MYIHLAFSIMVIYDKANIVNFNNGKPMNAYKSSKVQYSEKNR